MRCHNLNKAEFTEYARKKGLELHKAQRKIYESNKRFKLVVAGRRFGKTMLASIFTIIPKLLQDNKKVWIVGPTYDISERVFNKVEEILTQWGYEIDVKRTKKRMILSNGSELVYKSAKSRASLLGDGIDLLVVDEAGLLPDTVFYKYLRPTLVDKKGEAMFISTPQSKNWFYEEFIRGDTSEKDVFQFTTFDNPNIDPTELESVRLGIPEPIFEQEYLAKFNFSRNSVFGKAKDFVGSKYRLPTTQSEPVSIGIDFAKTNDWTVITTISKHTGEVIESERFNNIEWSEQIERIVELTKKYWNYEIFADATLR